MCGIAGVLGHPDANMLHRMNRLQNHRGPDENDIWLDEHVGFAHARLSILDLQSSQQPMSSSEGDGPSWQQVRCSRCRGVGILNLLRYQVENEVQLLLCMLQARQHSFPPEAAGLWDHRVL